MPSFDIVSELDNQEVLNTVDNANRELATRFDFRGVDAEFSLTDQVVTMKADAEFQLQQMLDIFRAKAVQRGLDVRSFKENDVVHSGKTYSQSLSLLQGIDSATAKKLVKLIKESKVKVQAAIQGEQVRVTGKKRDDLQQTMALVKQSDLEQPFQFTNFRD
ncbi:YajQ family cyclic di-GMP-binding protein [Alkalimonas collagenimarina]|uniref:Nucleotide-binding protein Q3O60_00140 n=1 Tax=Alkalimonas collagenimarina TaxID=400390 RepID=A0ABT9GU75_9GAMM|nr:YajQ family cyclic di-GMP-binding protein [Alkalimonas collagenimarina]MDP4534604.1 YajQ family cyclic di-GMP-binding protein [Alkalimonas collagenimarina]